MHEPIKMLRIKKLDIFIVKSFMMLFVGTFFICLFIFMMQFLWRYVDELVGKGLEMSVMAQFFFYSALTLVPVSLPLAVLLASLITFGNFGERYELLAMKAAGISLLKIMRPLVFFVCGLVGVSFYFQNVVGPIAQAKLGTLILSMKQKSPELDIPEGVFYSEIPDYNLKIAKKNRKTGMLYDVLIYDLKEGFEKARVIYADSGRLEMTADKQHLWLHLYSGDLFENLKAQSMKSQNVPYRRESFREKHTIIEFDSDFNMVDGDIMGRQSSAKDMAQLQSSIDSMKVLGDSIGRQYYKEVAEGNFRASYGLTKEDTAKIEKADIHEYNVDSLYEVASLTQKQKVISSAVSRAENVANDLGFKKFTMENNDYSIRKHKTEWHKKITISLSCLLFFFIGAPLGGIIRKGGLGMPVIVSVLVFIIYYIIDNIQTAIGNHQQIRFQYYEYTQEKKKILKHDGYYYVVNPYALEWKNDHYYLIGFSLKHQKIAHFRVDRLTSVENLETYFMPIEGFDVASYTNKMVDMFTSESSKEVTLLCENELMRVIIDHYGEDAAVDRYDDTHFTAKIEVNPSGTFYGWIFKFKGKIKILSPKECITEMQQIAQEFI